VAALGILFLLLAAACGIGSLVCFIMVLVKMFQNDQTTMGIVCIVLALCTGIGGLIAFVIGWINASKWKIQQLMMIWTGCFIGTLVLYVIAVVIAAAAAPAGGQFQINMN